jgi:hypothetical protein
MTGWLIDNYGKSPANILSDTRALAPKPQHMPLCGSVLDNKFEYDYFGMIINN